MKIVFSILVSICLTLSSLFYGTPIAPPEKLPPAKESEPVDTAYVYDPIKGANEGCFYIGRPDETKLTEIHSADFGMSESNSDNTQQLNDALSYCAANPGTKLVIDKGTYRFTSNDSICVFGCENLLVEGSGSRFIFTSTDCYNKILFRNSRYVEFRNLDTDWDWENDPVGSLVKIVGEDDNVHTIDMEYPEYVNVNENLAVKAMTICDPETFTMGADGQSDECYFYMQPYSIKSIQKIAPNVLRLTHDGCVDLFKAGQYFMLRHHVYDATVFRLEGESNNLTFEGINIYASSGMAFTVGEGCSRFQIKNTYIGIEPSQAGKRHVALGADAIHIADSKGYFNVEGCDISAMGDDALNVHDNLAYVTEVVNENTLKALVKFSPKVGTTVGFKDGEFNDIEAKAKITGIDLSEGEYTITFDKPVSQIAAKGYIFYDAECNSGNYVIRNNYFHENRARGLLLQSSNGLCENNRFYKTQGQAIKVVMDIQTGLWFEGTGVDNLVIRNNVFEQCNYSSWNTVIELGTNFDGRELSAQPFTNIVISHNEFINCHQYTLWAKSTNGMEINNNSITVDSTHKDNGKIFIAKSSHNITACDNTLRVGKLTLNSFPKCENFRVRTDVMSHMKGNTIC